MWCEEFHETTIHWKLDELGCSLWLDPEVVVFHEREPRLREALADRFAFGRLFASTRVAEVSGWKRYVYAMASCVLPPLFVFRAARGVTKKRRHIKRFLVASPTILLLTSVWALGECVGYCTGHAGRSLSPTAEQTSTTCTQLTPAE